jgi:hypothetical protein
MEIESMMKNVKFVMWACLFLMAAMFLNAAEGIKGSAKFSIAAPLFIAGKEMKPGMYDVKYTITGEEAVIIFTPQRQAKPFLEAKGKVRNSDQKFQENVILVGKDASGRSIGQAFQLAGKKFAIVIE